MICPQCGWEMPDTKEKCSHCGAELPSVEYEERADQTKKMFVSSEQSDGAGYEDKIYSALTEDFKLGRRYFEKENPFLAELFCRNAMALNTLSSLTGRVERRKKFVAAIEICEGSIKFTEASCFVCNGSGKRVVTGLSLSGSSIKASTTKPCSYCGGDGQIRLFRSSDDLKYMKGRALSVFESHQQHSRRVHVGKVWVPQAVGNSLSVEEKVKLKQLWPEPCEECGGAGLLQCSSCRGRGYVHCSNPDCKNGYVENKRSNKLGSGARTRSRCPNCRGLGFEKCSDCRGKGSVICERCRGTGKTPRCKSCDGTGLADCGKCDGTGKYDGETCPECGGEGKIECPPCNGYGRK
ncbi:MAG: zinc-ribbon domain-containing protein [Verrucomicrobiota bacterium]